ncbi:MAG TPA: hypothetical protein VF849_01550 [Blattabacteriaceae bacterium]
MTEKQKKILVYAYNELSEVFPHLVIIVSEKEIPNSIHHPDPNLFWFGGYIAAKHLIQDAGEKILRRKLTKVAPK